jgi:UDP-3-O-[3-hydroxymyristoyl] glucosamine N-acyltransferase
MKSLTLKEILELTQGQYKGILPLESLIKGVSEPEDAQEGHLVYAVNEKHIARVEKGNCTVALVPVGEWDLTCATIQVQNPYFAFAQVLDAMNPYVTSCTGISNQAFVHPDSEVGEGCVLYPGAFVDKDAKIGCGTVLFPGVYVGQGSSLGSDCVIFSNVSIREKVAIGDRVRIQPNAVIGGEGFGYVLHKGKHEKIPQVGGVIIENDVEIGSSVTIDCGTFRPTIIGEGTKIDNLVQIGHNVTTGKGCLMVSQSGISGSTKLGNYVTFAGQSGSVGHIEIEDQVIVCARGVATRNTAKGSKISGFPGRDHREDLKQMASLQRVPKIRSALKKLIAHLKLDIEV